MDDLTKGTWIINSVKHISRLKTNTPELSYFEATELAGKAGTLLARLVADEQEIVSGAKVKVLARESGITRGEIVSCLDGLKQLGKIDYTKDPSGNPKDVEIYCFSAKDALTTTSVLYDYLDPSENEQASLVSLDDTFKLPRYKSELIESLTAKGFREEASTVTLKMQEALELVKTSQGEKEPILYNEYAFAGNPEKIAKALKGLDSNERDTVEEVQKVLSERPGYPLDSLIRKYPREIVNMMEGVGLIDAMTVHSHFGDATFATLPQLAGISIGTPLLSLDVFHKAKVLLSCLRFGEVKSMSWRGRIDSHEKLLNIVNKLLRGDWVGPCTAIGQDYQLLEKDGVIVTRAYGNGMYVMRLRQREVGLLVKQILEYKRAFPEVSTELQKLLEKQPVGYTIPESRRSQILAQSTKSVREIQQKLLHSLRTGTKR